MNVFATDDPIVNARTPRAGVGTVEFACVLVIAAGLAWAGLPIARHGVDVHHDGVMLKPALDVLHGRVLFRDTFSQYGPLTTYLHAAGLWFSPTLLTLKMMSLAAITGSLALFYAAWREVLPATLAAVAAGCYLVFVPYLALGWMVLPWSSDFSMAFQSVALLAWMRLMREGGAKWAAVLGTASAAAFWCRQPVGLTLAVAAGVASAAAWATGWRAPGRDSTAKVALVAAGAFAAVCAAMVLGMIGGGALGAWWEQNILWPKRWAALGLGKDGTTWGRWAGETLQVNGLPALLGGLGLVVAPWIAGRLSGRVWSVRALGAYHAGLALVAALGWAWWRPAFLIPGAGWALAFIATIGALAAWSVAAAWLARRGGRAPGVEFYQVAGLAAVALASLAQVYPVPCQRHLFWALAPGFGAGIWGLWRLSGARAAWLAAGLALLLAPAVRERIGWAGYLARERLAEVERPAVLAGMRVEEPERDFLRWLDDLHAAIAQADGGAGAVMFGQDAMMIVPDRSGGGIGPYYVTWGGLIPAEAQRERWGWILAKRPAVLAHRMKSEVLDRFVKNERYTRAGRYDGADLDVYVPEEWVGRFVWPDTGEAAR